MLVSGCNGCCPKTIAMEQGDPLGWEAGKEASMLSKAR
jgi:hypothetical protein